MLPHLRRTHLARPAVVHTALVCAALAPRALAQDCATNFGPLAAESLVHEQTLWTQTWCQVALRAGGGYAYAWSDGLDVYLRRFDEDLVALGPAQRVNETLDAGTQDEPALGVSTTTGNLLVAWSERFGYDGEQMGIFGRVYDASGAPLGAEMQLNERWMASQWRPLIASSADGGFVVAWSGEWDGDAWMRRFDAAGQPLGPDQRVHEFSFDAQVDPAPAAAPDGSLFVAFVDFSSHAAGTTGLDLYGRTFDADGTPRQAQEFLLSELADSQGAQSAPRVAADGLSRFVVAWQDELADGDGSAIVARLFDGQGNALGPRFLVNAATAGDQREPRVAAAADGSFVIAWEDHASGTPRLLARRYAPDGTPLGFGFVVSEGLEPRLRPQLALSASGEELVFAFDRVPGGSEDTDAATRRWAWAQGPYAFCTAKTGSLGCVPAIGSAGSASLSDPTPFWITASGVRDHKLGLLFYGLGGASTPFQGGTLCIESVLARTAVQNSGGTPGACDGGFAFDFNAWLRSGAAPNLVAGTTVVAQYYWRDPQEPTGFGVGLSDALRFRICP